MGRRPQDHGNDSDGLPNLVADVAAHLEVREIDVFRLAHRWWFGREPEEQALERGFAAYMFRQEMPAWLRHFARQALETESLGPEEAARLGLDRQAVPAPRHSRLVVAATAAVFALLFAGILDTKHDPRTSATPASQARPMSCAGGGPGLVSLENFAYAFSGRDRPPC
ncbi:MAG: hypothetical protein OEM93_23550 [Rhodospirillales bacterium]|nr:hypothetical protein [Rhodospirillales bacterium]